MGGDHRFWTLFGGLWLTMGALFVMAALIALAFVDESAATGPVWLFFAIGAAGLVAGAFIVRWARAGAARAQRMMQSGVDVTATVTGLRRGLFRINRQWRWHVLYAYDDASAGRLEGESAALPGEAVEDINPGDKVRIKVDPARPEDSLFLGPA